MNFRKDIVLCLLFTLVLSEATLIAAQDSNDCKDHPLISRYAGATIEECEIKEFDRYTLT